jgi:hypothetical protein
VDTNELHAAFFNESRTRSRWMEQLTGNQGPGLGSVFSLIEVTMLAAGPSLSRWLK